MRQEVGRKQVRTLDSQAGAGPPRPLPPTQPRPTPAGLETAPAVASDLSLARGSRGPRETMPQAPPSTDQAFLTPWPGETPSNGPEPGKTDKCDKDGRSSWREGHLTYQVALQEGCGRRGGETEKERMCERQPDGQSHSWGGGGVPGPVGPFCRLPEGPGLERGAVPSVPPNRLEGLVSGIGPSVQDDTLECLGGPWGIWSGVSWGCASMGPTGLYLCALSSAASGCLKTSS